MPYVSVSVVNSRFMFFKIDSGNNTISIVDSNKLKPTKPSNWPCLAPSTTARNIPKADVTNE